MWFCKINPEKVSEKTFSSVRYEATLGQRLADHIDQMITTSNEVVRNIGSKEGNDHEVKFHEIEFQLFQEIKLLIMRSKFNFFMRSNLFNKIWQFQSGGWHFDHEIKIH
jgi:hypothetical protein